MITEYGNTFYAEFNDYDNLQVDEWLTNNVISNLLYNNTFHIPVVKKYNDDNDFYNLSFKGNTRYVKSKLIEWLSQFKSDIEIWSDCLSYDWVLFNNIFGTAFDIPKFIYYIPFDICTLFKIKGVDPDIDRLEFSELTNENKHNALSDAIMIKKCYYKLINM